MKKMFLACAILLMSTTMHAQNVSSDNSQARQKLMQITTIESVVGGGFGRSVMVITKDDGSTEERTMNNLFSLTGINMKNIKENESNILQVLKSFTDAGWKLMQAIPLSVSPGQNTSGIFMTRYLLTKAE